MQINNITIYFAPAILFLTPLVYLAVTLSNQALNLPNCLSSQFGFRLTSVGFKSNVHSAGVNDNAMNADIITDIAMVIANCWYNRPTIPGINPTGTNTAANISAMAITGADISFMACVVASFGVMPSSSI